MEKIIRKKEMENSHRYYRYYTSSSSQYNDVLKCHEENISKAFKDDNVWCVHIFNEQSFVEQTIGQTYIATLSEAKKYLEWFLKDQKNKLGEQ